MGDYKEKSFEPKAHILSLLGEELIKSPVMAIYELVKNSYDADATTVSVTFDNIDNLNLSSITISDNGTGMTEDVIENVWLEPGTDYRKPVDHKGTRTIQKSPIYNRIPMGEKGVGRFAVHKLSNKIKVITRPQLIKLNNSGEVISSVLANYEIHLNIDWNDFRRSKYLKDIKIKWHTKRDEQDFYYKKKSGTRIELSQLKEDWTKSMARQLKRHTLSMLSPKNNEKKFNIKLDFKNQWLINFPTAKEVLEQAPYKLTALVDKDFNLTFEYKFELKNNKIIGHRNIKNDKKYNVNIKGNIRAAYRNYLIENEYPDEDIDKILGDFDSIDNTQPYGDILVELYSFDLDSTSLKDYTNSTKVTKEILKEHAGIKVFKGDLRVYDYGDAGNDWLGLDLLRVQNKEWFSNNQNIGYVYLDPEASAALIEKTNREGFIENIAFEQFKRVVLYILTQFKSERQKDREKWMQYNKKSSPESVQNQLNKFKNLINNTNLDDIKKGELLGEAEKLEQRYEEDKKTLLIPAGVGMTASFALHEIEKLVPRMIDTTNAIKIDTRLIKNQVEELQEYVDGILSVLKKGGNKPVNVSEIVHQAVSNYGLRLQNRKIKVDVNIDKEVESIICDKRLLITMLMNIIDNSIYWLDTIYKKEKGIYIIVSKSESSTNILIVDNGPGFKDDIEDLVRPFFTRKDGGIGIGMYLIDTIMIQYGRLNILYPDELATMNIPKEYRGAAVELIFSKNKIA